MKEKLSSLIKLLESKFLQRVKEKKLWLLIVELSLIIILGIILIVLLTKSKALHDQLQYEARKEQLEASVETEVLVIETPKPSIVPSPTTTPVPDFNPSGDVSAVTETVISVNGTVVDSYCAEETNLVNLSVADLYTSVEGITTYGGNNFRDSMQYGSALIEDKSFADDNKKFKTEDLADVYGNLCSGFGEGHPLVAHWTSETLKNIGVYGWAKELDELTEIIFPSQDGYIYFIDVESNNTTREAIYLGFSMDSFATLDPRGYPLLYVGGSKVNGDGENPEFLIINLIDNSVVYQVGKTDPFSRNWTSIFSTAPIVDAASDQLIFTGENGILYLLKLNSSYDSETGKLIVEPGNLIRWKCTTENADQFGFQASPIVYEGYIIAANTGGDLLCVDLNTFEVKWCLDGLGRVVSTPAFEMDSNGIPSVYLASSFEADSQNAGKSNKVYIYKVNANNGTIIWEKEYSCEISSSFQSGVIGGIALGKGILYDYLYVNLAQYPTEEEGQLLCINKSDGEAVWAYQSEFSISSPVCFYDSYGRGYLLNATNQTGKLYFLDGLNGSVYKLYDFEAEISSTPVVYNNNVIVGTDSYYMFNLELK